MWKNCFNDPWDVYRPVPAISQQAFQQPMAIIVENSRLVNEMIMELLQNPRAIRDTLHLMTTFAQKPQHKEQIDEEAKDKEAKEEEKD